MSKILHLDSDIICHKTCCVLDKVLTQAGKPLPFRKFTELAADMTTHWVKQAQETFEIKKVYTHLTSKDRSNFRYKIECEIPYKSNRKDTPDPRYLHELREWYASKYRSHITHGREADDTIGIECTKNPRGTVRYSEKDLRMIPGWHIESSTAFNNVPIYVDDPGVLYLQRKLNGKVYVEGWGYKWFCAQMIIGDAADGVKGLKGLGDVAAYDYLGKCHSEEECDDVIKKLYLEKSTIEQYEINKQFLWILREPL